MFTVVGQILRLVIHFLEISCLFVIGRILVRLSCARKLIIKSMNKIASVPLPVELYWDSLFSWDMMKSLWELGVLDIRKTATRGKPTPNPVLVDPDTGNEIELLKITSRRKLQVLAFGSYSCPVFRLKFDELKSIAQEFRRIADFMIIYIDEAHPADGWSFKDDIPIFKHCTMEDRLKAVKKLRAFDEQQLIRVYADSMKNEASKLFGVNTIRLYVIQDEKVVYEGGIGPIDYRLGDVKQLITNVCTLV